MASAKPVSTEYVSVRSAGEGACRSSGPTADGERAWDGGRAVTPGDYWIIDWGRVAEGLTVARVLPYGVTAVGSGGWPCGPKGAVELQSAELLEACPSEPRGVA